MRITLLDARISTSNSTFEGTKTERKTVDALDSVMFLCLHNQVHTLFYVTMMSSYVVVFLHFMTFHLGMKFLHLAR